MIAFAAFIAAGIYVNLFFAPVRHTVVAKVEAAKANDLESATTNEVMASLGKPFQIVDSTNFIESADQMAEEGYPISNADMRPRGRVWLYPEGRVNSAGVRKYQTIFFDGNNRVYAMYTTYWSRDVWQEKN